MQLFLDSPELSTVPEGYFSGMHFHSGPSTAPERFSHSAGGDPLSFSPPVRYDVVAMNSFLREPDGCEPGALAEAVARLSRILTRERDRLPEAYLQDRTLREAYVRYFLPANLDKVRLPLRELSLHPAKLLNKERLRVLDLGSGPGTALLGTCGYFATSGNSPFLDCTAVDHVAGNLRDAERLFREQAAASAWRASLRTVRSSVEEAHRRLDGRSDIIILSNVLNEVGRRDADRPEQRTVLVGHVLDRLLDDEGSCIIIEPALRGTSRDLLLVRDGLADAGRTVYSPCLTQGECPALQNPKDWCHEDRPWQPPEVVREIDRLTGLRKDSLKFSYVVLRKDGRTLADVCGIDAWRVVSEPLVSRGKREYYLCGAPGRRLATRLDRDAVDGNRPFGGLRRGDLVRFEGLVVEERRLRVGNGTVVRIVPAG